MSAEYIEYLNAIVQDLYQKGLDLPIQFKESKGIDFDVSLSALQGFLEFNEMLAYAESGFYVNILDYETPLTFAERLRKSSTKEFAQRLQEERELDELIEDITKADSSEYKFSVDSSAEDAVVFVDTEDMNTEQAGEFIEQHNLPEYTEVGSNAAEMFTEMLGLDEEDAEGVEEDSTEEEEDYVDENGVHHSRYSSRFNDIDDSKLYADEIAEKRAYQAEVEEEVLSLDEEYTGDTDIEVEEEVLDVSGTDTESTETEGNDIDDYLLDDAEETSEGTETYPETNTEPPESVSEDFEGNDTPEEDNALESLVAPSEGEGFSEQETAEDFVHSERLPSTGVEGATQDLGIAESTTPENDKGTSGVEGVTQGEDSENVASLDEISFDSEEEDGDTFEVEGGFLQSGESVDTFMCHSHSSDETDNGSDKNKITNTEETNGDNLFFDSEDDFDFNFGDDEEDEEDSLGDESDYSGVTETPQGGINYCQNEYNAIGADTRDTDEKIADFLVSLITKSTSSLKNLFRRFGSES